MWRLRARFATARPGRHGAKRKPAALRRVPVSSVRHRAPNALQRALKALAERIARGDKPDCCRAPALESKIMLWT